MSLKKKKKRGFTVLKHALCSAIILAVLCGCSGKKENSDKGKNNSDKSGAQNASTDSEPVTLEQEL